LNPTVDNVNKMTTEGSEGLKDLGLLLSNLNDTLKAVEDMARGVDSIISTKKEPEIKLP